LSVSPFIILTKTSSCALEVLQVKTDETAVNLANLVQSCLENWNIFDKVEHIVTDSDPKMKCMTTENLKKRNFPSVAQTLNLAVKNVLGNLEDTDPVMAAIQKSKNHVSFFHRSAKASRHLQNVNSTTLEEGERPPRKLIQYASNIIIMIIIIITINNVIVIITHYYRY